jgi:RHS repeat-associated protein
LDSRSPGVCPSTQSTRYQPYGEKLTSAGAAATSYGFGGEWTDEVAGVLYLRASQYSPSQGRFISKDTWPGEYTRPASLNKWNYANSNPLKYIKRPMSNPTLWDGSNHMHGPFY